MRERIQKKQAMRVEITKKRPTQVQTPFQNNDTITSHHRGNDTSVRLSLTKGNEARLTFCDISDSIHIHIKNVLIIG